MPREHGAWGMLLVPFATAVATAGVLDWKVALLLVSTLSFYIARASWLKRQFKWTTLLLATSLAAATPLLFAWKLWWIAAFGAVAALLAAQRTQRSLAMQLAATGGLTLTAPAAWYAATGALDATAFWLWLWNTLYFAGGLLYVRMRITRTGPRWPVLGFYGALLVFVLVLAAANVVSCRLLLVFAPAAARAAIGAGRLASPLRVKCLGWSEVAHSILFGALLAVALR